MAKIVRDPKTEEVITIDEKKHPNWKTKFYHRSGVPFKGAKKIKEQKEADTESKTSLLESMEIETLRTIYEETLWKKVAPRYKNDKTWIISKLV